MKDMKKTYMTPDTGITVLGYNCMRAESTKIDITDENVDSSDKVKGQSHTDDGSGIWDTDW